MKFITNVDKEKYKEFCDNYPYFNLMQSYEWGEFSKKIRNQNPHYVGLIDDNDNLIAAALLLEKRYPLNMCYIYSPRGFMIDYNNKELLKFWTEEVIKYIKSLNAVYLKFDPEIKYQDIDADANPIPGGFNNYELFQNILDAGYTHSGFNKLYEHNQPRYTFRIDLNQSMEEIESKMSKSYLKTIKRSYYYDLEISISDDIKTFYDLIQNVAEKDKFNSYSYEYYQTQYDLWKDSKNMVIHTAKIYPDKVLEKVRAEYSELKEKKKADPDKLKRLERDIELFQKYEGKYPDGKVICSLVCEYTKLGGWSMYIGDDELGIYTMVVNRCYYEYIKYAKDQGCQFADLFGTVGDPKTTVKNYGSLHDYKRKVGGEYIEFIGEFNYINKPFWNAVLPKVLWIFRKIRRLLGKK